MVVSGRQKHHQSLQDQLTYISFYINLPCGALAAASIFFFFQSPKVVKPVEASMKEKLLQMDIPGFLIITAAVVCYLLTLQWGGVIKAWGSADVVGTLVGAFILFLAFLANEYYQGKRSLLQSKILRNRTVAYGCAFCFL